MTKKKQTAAEIRKDRGGKYGPITKNVIEIQIFALRCIGKSMTAEEVMAVMVGGKFSRMQNSQFDRDHLMDAGNYCHLWQEVRDVYDDFLAKHYPGYVGILKAR